MITTKEVIKKEIGDAIVEFQGKITKVLKFRTGTSDRGAWTLQTLEAIDDAGDKIDIQLKNRSEVALSARGMFIHASAVEGKRKAWVGCERDQYENTPRILVKEAGRVCVYVKNEWHDIPLMEKTNTAPPSPNGTATNDTSNNAPPPPTTNDAPPTPATTKKQVPMDKLDEAAKAEEEKRQKKLAQANAEMDRKEISIVCSACISYAKDLVVAGKRDYSDLGKTAEDLFNTYQKIIKGEPINGNARPE